MDGLLKNRRELSDAEYVLNPDSGRFNSEKGRAVGLQLGASEKGSMPMI